MWRVCPKCKGMTRQNPCDRCEDIASSPHGPLRENASKLMFAEGKISGRIEACEVIRKVMEFEGIGEAERAFGEVLISYIEPPVHLRGE